MKMIICLLLIATSLGTTLVSAQNIGIGTTEPLNKLHINGNLLVNTPTTSTSTAPTAGQTKTMVNASTIIFTSSDSTGRIYDPGGPSGNYNANLLANVDISTSSNIGIEITVESMQLGAGDSLIISEFSGATRLLAVGNGYNTTGKLVFNTGIGTLYIIFKSNADASVGSGFSLIFRRLYDNSPSLPDVSGYTGKALLFDTKSGAFRSGIISNLPMGYNSTAMGVVTTASGYSSIATGFFTTASNDYSTAMGNNTNANGIASTAMGYNTKANGNSSTATGSGSTASGPGSTAMGGGTTASGTLSTAMGNNTTASGDRSTAMGYNASTNGQDNSFAIGGTGAATNCTAPNQFMTRFDNYTFWISASNYAYLLPSSNGWAYTSDKNKKERFEELDGESVLKKISGIPFSSWNFKANDTRQYRHYGITAQDFYNAFGKDSYGNIGNDTTVSPLDMLGVAYSAIKALEKRSTDLAQDNKQLKDENAFLQKNIAEIKDGYALANTALSQKLALLEARLNELAALKEKDASAAITIAKQNK